MTSALTKKVLIVLDSYEASALARLRVHDNIQITYDLKDLEKAEIALIRSRCKINDDFLAKAKNLKLVVSATSGIDHMDWQLAQKHGVICCHTPEANCESAAQLTISHLLNLYRQILPAVRNTQKAKWRDELTRTRTLEGQTLGVVGLGRIGSRVASIAQFLGMKVVGYDPYVSESYWQKHKIEKLAFIELLRVSDAVTFHTPLTHETKYMMAYPTLRLMLPHAFLINCARGAIIDNQELLVALNEGVIAGAALDVLEKEPPDSTNALLKHPKLLLTPHIGAWTDQAFEAASHAAVDRVFQYLNGQKLHDSLPLENSWFSAP